MYRLMPRSVIAAVACAAVGAASVLTVAPAEAVPTLESNCTPGEGSASFAYTGEPQSFTVPAGVTAVDIAVSGASGGAYIIPPETLPPMFPEDEPIELPGHTFAGGPGAKFTTESIVVTPGDSLTVIIGGAGVDTTSNAGGGTGQGGGGGSFVYATPTTDGLLVAAGGGGGSGYGVPGGGATTSPAGSGLGGSGGSGGSDSGGGGGAGLLGDGADGGQGNGPGPTSTGGSAGQAAPAFTGGSGGDLVGFNRPGTAGGFGGGGGGGAGGYMGAGGGGGGGYTGGAGGAGGTGGGGMPVGGNGGASYSLGTMAGIDTNTGNGAVTISRTVATTTFDTQGGSAAPDPETTNVGCVIPAPGDPTRAGYEFSGWFSSPTGGVLRDFADPVGSDSTLYAQWSPMPPEISARVFSTRPKNSSGWYRTPVTVEFTCTIHTADLVGGCPPAVQLIQDGHGQSLTRTITDTDGRVAAVTVTGINIDRTAPTLRVVGVRSGATYVRAPKLVCRATDAVSGVASCRLTRRVISRRAHLVVYGYRAVATDRAGNVRVTTGRYRLRIA